MSFQNKTDYCGLGSISGLELKSCATGKSAQFLEKNGADGSIVKTEYFGEVSSPSCEYELSGNVSLASVKFGASITFETSHKVTLSSISVKTSAGSIPTVSATAVQIPDAATSGCVCKYTLPTTAIHCSCHAQNFGAFNLTGADCVLLDTSFDASADIVTSTVNGLPKAADVANGKIVVTATIGKYGSAVPSVTAASGWTMSSPLDCSDPDSDFPTYTVSFEKTLAVDVVNAG